MLKRPWSLCLLESELKNAVGLMIRFLIITLVAVLSMSGAYSFAADKVLEEVARQSLKESQVAGATIARIESGRLAEVIALGNASSDGDALTPESVFQVGSISKPVAAWAAMTLVRDNKVDLDAPIQNYISRWAVPKSDFDERQITLRRLLSHTAGLSLHGYPGFPENEPLPSVEESLSGMTNGAGKVTLFQTPGTGFSYSGGGYTLLQLLVEEVSGMPFHQYAQQAVLDPLGMTSSSYQPSEELLRRRVKPHGFKLDTIPDHHFRAQAAAALHTTAGDLAKFLQANITDNSVLPADLMALMHSDVADAGFAQVGLVFFVFGDGALLGHGGANQGWRADLLFSKDTKSGLAILANSENGGALINAVRCAWDADYGPKALQKKCIADQASASRIKRLFSILAGITIVLAVSLLIWRLSLSLRKRARIQLPSGSDKRVGLVLSIGAMSVWLVLMYTPLGAVLISGFPTPFDTINYLPPSFENFSYAVVALLASITLSLCIQKK